MQALHPRLTEKIAHLDGILDYMSRQTRDERNEGQRKRYAKRTQKSSNLKIARDFGIVGDRSVKHLSLSKIASKRGVSVGCVRAVLAKITVS